MDNNPTPQPTPAPAAPAPAPAPAADQPLFANNNAGGAKKSHTGLIVGLVLGIVAIAAFLVVLFVVILPGMNNNNNNNGNNGNTSKTKDPDPTPNPDPDPTPTPTPTKVTKTLVCTAKEVEDDYTQDVTLTITYVDDALDKVSILEETWQKGGFTDAEIEAAQKENNSHYDSTKFSKWVVKRKDANTVILEADVIINDDNTSNFKTYDEGKAFAISNGYSCQ